MSHDVAANQAFTDEPAGERLRLEVDRAINRGLAWSVERQDRSGFWVGKLQSNSCMEAEWILALHVLGLNDHPIRPGLIRALLNEQRDDGSWEVYFDAPAGDINATVESYAALRCGGMDPDAEPLRKARDWILERGGLKHVRVFTRYWLALIGEWPWEKTPNIPPEVLYFPNWFPFSIYNFSSWARATLVPISILSARRPVHPLPDGAALDELFPDGRAAFDYSLQKKTAPFTLERFFLWTDRALHRMQNWRLHPGRNGAIRHALEWIIRHQDADGVWGGIQPPWIYGLMALHCEGYPHSHPVMAKAIGALSDPRWSYQRDGATYVHASVSPVWDTVLTLFAMHDCEATEAHSDEVERAIQWLLDNEVRTRGDWSVKVPDAEPGGWAFEYANAHYPDIDDTAVAMIVLAPFRDDPSWIARGLPEALDRATQWVLAMQSWNGGWGAFDKDNDRAILTKIPFCDFGEALDPPSVDVTAHVLEGLAALGFGVDHPAVQRGLQFLRDEQEADGSWWGRWGVNYIYGTSAALPAFRALGEDMRADHILKAADWIVDKQNDEGGWGESCGSYMDPRLAGRGASTASQTAWALMALLAVGRPEDDKVIRRGLSYLTAKQEHGTWNEPFFTGTGFPGYGIGGRIKLRKARLMEY